jgi:hypothetical protein
VKLCYVYFKVRMRGMKNIKENHQEKQKGSQNSIKNKIFIVI